MTWREAPRELVLASAGSGKTYRITSRLIELLAAGEPVESILASTFTRKAAGQILDRLLLRLAGAALREGDAHALSDEVGATGGGRQPLDRTRWQALLSQVVRALHRTTVGTLDSFFVRSAGTFEAELGLPPDWRIAEVSATKDLTSVALQRVLEARDRGSVAELLRLVARGDARRSVHDALTEVLDQLLEIEEQLDPLAENAWSAFRVTGMPAPATRQECEILARVLEELTPPARGNWPRALDRTASALRLGDWEGVAGTTLCKRAASRDYVYDGVPFPDDVRRVLEAVLELTRRALRWKLVSQVESLGALTRAYRSDYRQAQRERRLFGFNDLTRLIGSGDPIGAREDLHYRLDGRIRHLLLDEFQDTSLPQWEALAPLATEVLSDAGRAAVVVADPKQSIYGWRGAEPGLVHAVGEHYQLEESHLDRSWRSSQTVLDFVNAVFQELPENPALALDGVCRMIAEDWSRDFRRHVAAKQLPGYVAVEVGPADEGRGSTRQELCRYAAQRIAALHVESPGFTIGVLTRTNAAVARLYLDLRRLGVPVSQEGGNPLTDSAACEIALAAVRLADHPQDSIAAYMVAKSPLGTPLRLTDQRDRAGSRRLARELRERFLHDGYGRTLEWIASLLAPSCDAREARRLSQLSELGFRYDQRPTLRTVDFIRLVETERVEDRSTAAVRIMTVHQAKGLEFDIVVLPQLDQPLWGNSPLPVIPLRSHPAGRITGILPSVNGDIRCLFPELEEAERVRRGRIARDGLSSLYVALTRPRYALHLILPPETTSAKWVTPARIIRAAIGAPIGGREIPGTLLYEAGSGDWHRAPGVTGEAAGSPENTLPAVLRLEIGAGTRRLRRERPSDLHHAGGIDARELLRLDTEEAMERGTMVHALFEQVEWLEEFAASDDLLRAICRRSAPNAADDRIREIVGEFRSWLHQPEIGAVLTRSRHSADAVVERELPFAIRRGDALVEGVIDRIVLTRSGGSYAAADIVDYKTDRITSDGIRGAVERYAPQLRAYARAVSELYGIPVEKCASRLVFLEPRRVVLVPAGRIQQESLLLLS